jgi:amidase
MLADRWWWRRAVVGAVAMVLAVAMPGVGRGATFQLTEATIADMQEAMNAGGVSSVELVALYLNRIMAYDRSGPTLRAVAQLDPNVFAAAAASDRRRASGGPIGPLEGVPFVVKDSYDVAGLASAAGARVLRKLIAKTDAPVVRALKDAGAVLLGKSNMWAFAYAIPYDPDSRYAWGRARNPYTLQNDFGGSSTGSAAATAANLCGFAMGGDTGSSIRLPSARTALVGGRPSYELLPSSGIIPTNPSLDVIGPMTRTVEDNARVMDVVVFDDPAPLAPGYFPLPSSVRPPTYTAELSPTALAGTVIGLPRPYIGRDPDAAPLDPVVQALWDDAVATLVALGATVKEIDWPFIHNYRGDTPSGAANGYASVGLTEEQFKTIWQWTDAYYFNEHLKAYRYRRVPNVLRLPSPTRRQDPEGFDKIAGYKKAVRDGTARPYADYGFDAYFAAYRHWAKRDVEDVMAAEGVDLLAFPVAGGDDPDADQYEFLNGLNEGSFLGLPQLSVPLGIAPSGRPHGMMLMARTYYTEATLLGAAYAFEQATHARRPPASTPPLPGETIEYEPAPPASRPEIDPPVLEARLRRRGGRRVTITGTAGDASPLASVRVYLNGRLVHETTEPSWRVSATFDGPPRDALAMVVAKDVHGNAAATMLPLRRP